MIYFHLKNVRLSRNLTTTELSNKMGSNHSRLLEMERGAFTRFTFEFLNNACRALDCSIDDLITISKDEIND